MKKTLVFALAMAALQATAQENPTAYVKPTDDLVLKKLDTWQDIKFGLMMHWGTYSQWGVVESWSICPEDEGWTQRRGPYAASYNDYKKAYENLQTTFNPVKFDAGKWADAAAAAGMKYVVFTTKHHDGFCMFDTKETDYKITSSKTPFSKDPRANVANVVFDAFRKKGFLIGAYFSKPDWHTENYWWPYFPPKDRNVNYDPKKYPDRWNAFKQFTYNQIQELMTGYGKMDILWLDGGWVRPYSSIDKNVDWQRTIPYDQDIDMKKIAAMARQNQPGLMVVDRSVGGEFENYQTPEQQVPAKALDYPWETCMTMGDSWSYVPNDHYKSSNQLVHLLIKIVSRGGNFLLNVGPSPEGDWSDTAYMRLREIGEWMQVNGEGIYNSRPIAPYGKNNIAYTQSKDGKTKYVFVMSNDADEHFFIPPSVDLDASLVSVNTKVTLLGFKGDCKIEQVNGGPEIIVPKQLAGKNTKYGAVFRLVD